MLPLVPQAHKATDASGGTPLVAESAVLELLHDEVIHATGSQISHADAAENRQNMLVDDGQIVCIAGRLYTQFC